jgi:hypothetical protein
VQGGVFSPGLVVDDRVGGIAVKFLRANEKTGVCELKDALWPRRRWGTGVSLAMEE